MDGRKIIVLRNFSKTSTLPETVKWENKDKIEQMTLAVGSATKDVLIAIELSNTISTDDEFKAILQVADDRAQGKDHIILVHETTTVHGCKITEDEKRNMLNEYFKECYELFSGFTETNTAIYDHLLTKDFSIRDNIFDSEDNLKKEVFEAIWNEYSVKKKLVRLKYNFLSNYLPIVIDMRGLKECADRGDSTKTSEYLSEIKAQKNWVLPSEISLDKHICPSDELRKEINQAIKNIPSLGKIIEASSITAQNVVNIMYSKQFNIDDWYSELGECFERNT